MGEIKLDAHNYRIHDDKNLKLIKRSLKKLGAGRSILIDADGVIIAGNATYKTAQELGIPVETIPIDGSKVVALQRTDLHTQDKERKEMALMDNTTSANPNYDYGEIKTDFNTDELPELGIDDIPTLAEENAEIVEDELPEEVETRCKKGDIWQLGDHRLMCGDSTVITDVEKLMNGEKSDVVFTDPPYGMKKEKEGVLNDNLNYDDLLEFNKEWIPISFGALKENGSWYCWGTDEPLMDIYSHIIKPMIKDQKATFRNLITWDKGNGQGQNYEGYRMYAIADEKCLFVMCGVQGFNNNSDNYFESWESVRKYLANEADKVGLTPNKVKEICGVGMYSHWFTKSQWQLIPQEHYKKLQNFYKDSFKREYDEIKREYYATRAYFDNTHDNQNNVWHFERTSGKEKSLTGGHATPKPIALCSRAIKSSSRENETVLDLFGGSGSTLIACEQLKRKCRMMELDPHYCDVIITRWETLTGKQAQRIE